jgi:putative acetyltransferase
MIATIRHATTPADFALARALFIEYAQWLNVDLCFQGFDEELASLPGAYAPPEGRLLLAGEEGDAFGCIALRPLVVDSGRVDGAAEIKRLFVQERARRGRWGGQLVDALIVEARAIGYARLCLDTLDWMTAARSLYASRAFVECEPYYNNPLLGAVYMALDLGRR